MGEWSAELYWAGGELANLPEALSNNSAVLTKTQLLNKVSKHLDRYKWWIGTDRVFGETPMRASPADLEFGAPIRFVLSAVFIGEQG